MSVSFPRLIVRVVFCLGSSNVCSRLTGCDCHAVTDWVYDHEQACGPARFLASHTVTENKCNLFTFNP